MTPADPWVALLAAMMGASVACVSGLASRAVLAARRDLAQPRVALPLWLRLVLPAAAALAPLWRRVCGAASIARAGVRLRRADLDDSIRAGEWLALPPAMALAGVVAAAAARGGPMTVLAAAMAGACWPALWLRDRRRALARAIDRELPHLLELLTLAVEGGCALGAALRIAVDAGSAGVLQRGLAEALQAIRAGRPRDEALANLAHRYEHAGLHAMVGAIVHAEASGAGVAATLRAQSVQRTEERFARAERLAMESPVKMLAPLILCIFPCAFLVIGFPIAHRLLQWA
ncbi:MAG: type II secretion system F family protein [Steroidobacteraceae bacterium]